MTPKAIEGITKRARRTMANTEERKLLTSLAKQKKPFLQTLEQHPLVAHSPKAALTLVFDALDKADRVLQTCCRSTYLTAMFCDWRNSEMVKHTTHKLEHNTFSQRPSLV